LRFGTLYGIGVGPGDPELLTLKAVRILQQVPVVFVPVTRPGAESLAARIAGPHLPATVEVAPLVFAMRAEGAVMADRWEQNAATVGARLALGQDAAFLTEGDPSLYSTFQHVAGCLRRQHPEADIQVIPGVSSIQAVAAAAGVALADADERLALLPATYEDKALTSAFRDFDTVVLLKVAGALERVLDRLDALGLTANARCVVRCGQPGERVIADVNTLRGAKLDYFSTMIVRTKP